jgi:hypothetical protein
MAKPLAILSLSCALVLGALTAGLAWLHWHDLQVQVHDLATQRVLNRELVRAKMEACRLAYQNGGVAGLKLYTDREADFERNTTFVEVLAPNKSVIFSQEPPDARVTRTLSSAKTDPLEWVNIPVAGHKRQWTIGRENLPDGAVLFVGRAQADVQQGA